ncbi:MAG: hypothetical protein HUJ25_03495 [Crocinitomicaceae bacterium]|nr:hypothetical protein [Crocinitomicaceae bacterium]
MRLTQNILFLIILLSGVTACKKKTTVVIQAEDYITGSGTAYAGMQYSVVETWTPFFEVKSNTVASGVLDENGAASFELKMKENRKYNLGIETPDNICYTEVSIQEPLTYGENNAVNFKYAACGYLKFILNNTNCFDSTDKIEYTRTWLTGNKGDGTNIYYGCDYFEGSFFPVPAGDYKYDWEVTKNSVTDFFSQSFTIANGDSTIFQIDY